VNKLLQESHFFFEIGLHLAKEGDMRGEGQIHIDYGITLLAKD
jgi:hypothetical protein